MNELTKMKELVVLHKISPLKKIRQMLIWLKIKNKLQLGFFHRINNYIKVLGASILAATLTLTTFTSSADIVVLEAEKTGWDAIIDDDELRISAINPMIVAKNEVCVLWVEHNNNITMLAKLPERGITQMVISDELIAKLDNGKVLISIEDKDDITKPQKIEYSGVIK